MCYPEDFDGHEITVFSTPAVKQALPLIEWVIFTESLHQDKDRVHQGESKLH